jgi:hypothetical protein
MKNAEDDRFDRVITREHFTQVYERIKTELEVANIEMSKLSKDHTKTIKVLDELLAFTDDIYKSYNQADNELKRRYLQIFFEKVIVNDGRIVEVIYTPAISQLLEIDRVRITNNWRTMRSLIRTLIFSMDAVIYSVSTDVFKPSLLSLT